MNKTIILIITISSMLLFACMSEPEYETERGKNVIPKDTLELMIIDIHTADALITSKILKSKGTLATDSLIYQGIYDKYQYSREDFDQTLLYYVHHEMDTLNVMYDRVIEKLNIEKGQIYN